jgi:hypothetical protein
MYLRFIFQEGVFITICFIHILEKNNFFTRATASPAPPLWESSIGIEFEKALSKAWLQKKNPKTKDAHN